MSLDAAWRPLGVQRSGRRTVLRARRFRCGQAPAPPCCERVPRLASLRPLRGGVSIAEDLGLGGLVAASGPPETRRAPLRSNRFAAGPRPQDDDAMRRSVPIERRDRTRRSAENLARDRRRILAVLAERGDHPTFHDLHLAVRASGLRCGRNTLVIALHQFLEAGLVTKHVFNDGRTRSRAVHPGASRPHDRSGHRGHRVLEVDEVASAFQRRAAALGFKLQSFRFELSGRRGGPDQL